MNKKDNFILKYIFLGLLIFLIISVIASVLPGIVKESIFSPMCTVIFLIYILFFIVFKINQNVKQSKNDSDHKSVFIGKLVVIGSIIIFAILVYGYHNDGPRGATNDCYDDFKLVSCEKVTSVYGETVYTCLRDGKKSAVLCDNKVCNAVCEG